MLKQGSFVNKTYNGFLIRNIWGCLAYVINLMIDSLISGNQLGEVALQAVSIVYPLYSVIFFFSYLIPLGSSVIFGKSVGEFKTEKAYRAVGTSTISSIAIGLFLAIGLWIIKMPFLTYFECSGLLLEEASAYYNWLIVFALIEPIKNLVYYFIITDGEATLLSVGNILDIGANIVLSIVLSQSYGIAGLGIATCIGLVLRTISYCIHFLKKANSVKIRFCLDINVLKKSIALSFENYMYYLFLAIVDIVMNKIIIVSCGMDYIPAYSVINLVFSVCEIFDASYNSSVGLITCFLGEKNNHDMQLVFRRITRSIIIMGTMITLLFFFGAPLIPVIYGLETKTTIQVAIVTCRIMAFTSLGFGTSYIICCISGSIEKPGQACLLSFLNYAFSPLLLALVFGSFWGFIGIAIGMCLSPYLAFGLYALIRIPQKGKKSFPVYVEDFGEDGYSYNLHITPESITEIRDAVCAEMEKHEYQIENIGLLIEELFTRVLEKNSGKTVTAECTLLFGPNHVRIIIRDDGVLFDFVDENNKIESLNAHVLNSLLEKTEQKNYLVTTSFNRNGFVFEK